MGIVVRLADFRRPAIDQRVPSLPADVQRLAGLTLRDRCDLESWATHERRVSLCSCDLGVFAMLYEHDASWASCGVVRQDGSVLLWDCVTLADIGRFPSMCDALRAMPPARRAVPVPPAAAHRHCALVG